MRPTLPGRAGATGSFLEKRQHYRHGCPLDAGLDLQAASELPSPLFHTCYSDTGRGPRARFPEMPLQDSRWYAPAPVGDGEHDLAGLPAQPDCCRPAPRVPVNVGQALLYDPVQCSATSPGTSPRSGGISRYTWVPL